MADWHDWIGREEIREDRLTRSMVDRLFAVLDVPVADRSAIAPPLAHWLCFLPDAPQSAIGIDGHPRRGGFLPAIDLPRRMWAGGRLDFHAPLPFDTAIMRRSTILNVTNKTGASGRLAFVTVRHEVSAMGSVLVTEEQDIVYREASSSASAANGLLANQTCDFETTRTADPILLFRFSALTFNAHRIHYDRDYACREEGYAGLVVHGPLSAMLLMDFWQSTSFPARPSRMSFSARRPLFDNAPFRLRLARGGEGDRLSICDQDGYETMSAQIR